MKQFNLENEDKINTGFKIPDSYFEQFEAKIMNQVFKEEVKVISLFQRKKFWFSAVAAVLVLSIAIPMYFNYITANNFSSEDYLAYENTITNEDIAAHLSDEDIIAIEKSLNLYEIEKKSDIEDYLY